jgi:hypothetical protein
MPSTLKRSLIIIGLLCTIILSATGTVDRGLYLCGLGQLEKANQRYLESAFDRSLAGFLLLSTIKSGLAVVEGSDIGVGFHLELGDIVQPVYDYVDIAWRAALAGGSILAAMQLAVKGLALIDHWVLAGLGLVLIGHCVAIWVFPNIKRLERGTKQAARFGTTLCMVLYLLLPLSITGATALSRYITGPVVDQAHEQLRELGSALSPEHLSQNFFSENSDTGFSANDLKSALASAGRGVQALISFLKIETERIAALTIKLVAAYLFDCILFPLLFGLILITIIKGSVRFVFDVGKGSLNH